MASSNNTVLVRDTVANLSSYLADKTSISQTTLENLLSTYVQSNQSDDLPLSSITPDFESNKAEMESMILAQNNPAWTIQIISEVGAMVLQMIATAQTMNQLAIELSLRETFVHLAQLVSSIYAGTTDLGVRITRKTPAYCTVSLTTTNVNTSYPPYTQFYIGGIPYFNRDQIYWTTSLTASFTLYQGTVTTTSFVSDGSAFQTYTFGNSDFAISNDDFVVSVNSVTFERTQYTDNYSEGLWEYTSTDNVYTENTSADGNAVIMFGDGTNGVIPAVNATIDITYVTTDGASGNLTLVNQPVTCGTDSTLTGTASTVSNYGVDNRDPYEYKYLSPGTFSAKFRPSTLTDYDAFACNYAGVVDAYFQAQQQLAPNDPSQAMIVKCTLLTSTSWDSVKLSAFTTWIMGSVAGRGYSGANIQIIPSLAVPVTVNITIVLYCYSTAILSVVETNVLANVNALFTLKAGLLGKSLELTDIERAIDLGNQDEIDYFDIQAPTAPVSLTYNQYITPGTINISAVPTSRRQ